MPPPIRSPEHVYDWVIVARRPPARATLGQPRRPEDGCISKGSRPAATPYAQGQDGGGVTETALANMWRGMNWSQAHPLMKHDDGMTQGKEE